MSGISNLLLENVYFKNPYTLGGSTASNTGSTGGAAFNSISGLTIRNCVFPATKHFSATLASVKNCVVTGSTFNMGGWGNNINISPANSALATTYKHENVDLSDPNNQFLDPLSIASPYTVPSISIQPYNAYTSTDPLQRSLARHHQQLDDSV